MESRCAPGAAAPGTEEGRFSQPVGNARATGQGQAGVFLMVRYRKSEAHRQIEEAICRTLDEYSLVPRRADWAHADNLLWGNVCRHMETS
jgi:hypothetical protein